MASIKEAFGTADQTLTITLASLASATAKESTAIDNSSNLYTDAFVHAVVVMGSSTPSSDKSVYFYVWGNTGGTTYPEGITGSNATYSIKSPCNLKLAAVINGTTASETLGCNFSVARCFGGILPAKWGVVVYNVTGQALAASGNAIYYQGVYATVA